MAGYQDYIKQSLQDFKMQRLSAKRKEVECYIDFYSGTEIGKYIKPYFDAVPFQEVPVYEMNITK